MAETKQDILVIDDEPEVRNMLKEFLESHGYNVRLAEDGIEAQAAMEEKVPALMLVDLLLPGEHGLNLIEKFKRKYFLPVLIISSIYQKEEIDSFMEEHLWKVFSKTSQPACNLTKIEEILYRDKSQ